jgi:opacity protein-like surface antigen
VAFLRYWPKVNFVTLLLFSGVRTFGLMGGCRFLLGGGIVLAAMAAAQAAPPAIDAAETSVRLGLTAGYDSYEENVRPQDTETGALLGLEAGASALTPSALGGLGWPDLYASVSYGFSAGLLHYKGNLQNPQQTPYYARDTSYFNTVIVRLGLGRPISGNMEIIPYAAGGYQNWSRNVGGFAGYGEYYQSGLIGGGLKLDVAATPLLVVSAVAEGFAVVGGTISVPSQDFSAGFGASAQERVSLDADYRINNGWHAYAGLGLVHNDFTGSKPDGSGAYEPLSTNLQVDSMLGLAYGF